ncbi:MAG: SpoIIE family protein phosphatase [Acidimicrobiales bacterium]
MPRILAGYASDTGRVRKRNEDLALVDPPLFAVADGMGGHVGGGEAAGLAIAALSQSFQQQSGSAGLIRSIQYANFVVWQKGIDDSRLTGMGTTMVALAYLLDDSPAGSDDMLRIGQLAENVAGSRDARRDRWYRRISRRRGRHIQEKTGSRRGGAAPAAAGGVVDGETAYTGSKVTSDTPATSGARGSFVVANVGDSRIYRYHGGRMVQISQDHSLAEELARRGKLTDAEAAVHPKRHTLTRVLGMGPEVEVDAWEVPVETGDRFLLCSDGLSNEVSGESIAAILEATPDPQRAADTMVRLANENGGSDNITVIIVDVHSDDPADPRPMPSSKASLSVTDTFPSSHPELPVRAPANQNRGEESPSPPPSLSSEHAGLPGSPDGAYSVQVAEQVLPIGDSTMMLDKAAIGMEVRNRSRKAGGGYALKLATTAATAVPPLAAWSKRKRQSAEDIHPSSLQVQARGPSSQLQPRPHQVGRESQAAGSLTAVPGARLLQRGTTYQAYAGQRLFSFRTVLFVLVFLVVVAGAFGVVRWYVNSSYFVMLKGDRVEVFQGRIGGLMGFEPHRVQATSVTSRDVAPYRISQLRAGVEKPSLPAADAYVRDLVAEEKSLKSSVTTSVGFPSIENPGGRSGRFIGYDGTTTERLHGSMIIMIHVANAMAGDIAVAEAGLGEKQRTEKRSPFATSYATGKVEMVVARTTVKEVFWTNA